LNKKSVSLFLLSMIFISVFLETNVDIDQVNEENIIIPKKIVTIASIDSTDSSVNQSDHIGKNKTTVPSFLEINDLEGKKHPTVNVSPEPALFIPDINNIDPYNNGDSTIITTRESNVNIAGTTATSAVTAGDLTVDGITVVISTSESYDTVVVKNGGNLTVTDPNVKITYGLFV